MLRIHITHTIVAGTQALAAEDNYIVVMDMDGLRRFRKRPEETPASKPAKGACNTHM